MDNIILTGMLKDFVQRHELSGEQTDRQFEKFANYCLLRTDHYDSFEFEKVGTGDCIGVDGVAVSIGGVIVDELEDARSLPKHSSRLGSSSRRRRHRRSSTWATSSNSLARSSSFSARTGRLCLPNCTKHLTLRP